MDDQAIDELFRFETEGGRITYNAYLDYTGGVSLISGDKLPEYEALPEKIRAAWIRAAMAVAEWAKK